MDEENTNTETAAETTATATPEAAPAGNDDGAKKRPGFLTVLGVLSFIGIALQIISNLGALGTMAGIVGIIAAIGCLYGVLQMWKLKKMGFYIYAVCEIAPVVVALITIGSAAFAFGAIGGGFMAVVAMLSMFFPVLFIILYALNLKHMS